MSEGESGASPSLQQGESSAAPSMQQSSSAHHLPQEDSSAALTGREHGTLLQRLSHSVRQSLASSSTSAGDAATQGDSKAFYIKRCGYNDMIVGP